MSKGLPRSLARSTRIKDVEALDALAGTLTGTVDGTIADIAATASAVVGGATPTAAQVDTGIALAVSTIVSGTNTQLKELQAKVNAILAALQV